MKRIIQILKDNNLLGSFYGDFGVYKMDEFIKQYKINKGSKNKFPSNIKRDFDGAFDLNDQPFIISDKDEPGNSFTKWIILSNGARVLLKEINQTEMENELLFKELCKELNIPCANVDIVTFEGVNLLASPSFLALNETLIDYYKLEDKAIMDIDDMINKGKKIGQDIFIRKVITCDILAENIDRFPNNFRVIQSPTKKRICPLFDNGLLREGKARTSLPYVNDSYDNDDILEYLMQDVEFKKWTYDKIITKTYPNFKEKLYQEKGIYIDKDNYEYFKESIENGKMLVLNAFKNS